MTPNPYLPGVYPSDGFHPEDGRIETVDETWSVVADYHSYLICALRRRDDGGLDLLGGGPPIDAVTLFTGSAPVRRYPGASRWSWRGRRRWLVFASPMEYPNYVGIAAAGGPGTETRGRSDLRGSAAALLAGVTQGIAKPVLDQLLDCGYRSLVRSADGMFEILGDPASPALPLVGRGQEQCVFLKPARELWLWDPTTGGQPTEPFRGSRGDLRLFHQMRKDAEAGYPTPHFHLDDGPNVAEALMVVPRNTGRP
jgi:hypothetical protein